MNVTDELDSCDTVADVDKVIRKIRTRRNTAKQTVTMMTNTARLITGTILTKRTYSEAVKLGSNWNKYDEPEEKIKKATPVIKLGVITILTDSVERTIGGFVKRSISDRADDMISEAERTRRRLIRRENNE